MFDIPPQKVLIVMIATTMPRGLSKNRFSPPYECTNNNNSLFNQQLINFFEATDPTSLILIHDQLENRQQSDHTIIRRKLSKSKLNFFVYNRIDFGLDHTIVVKYPSKLERRPKT